MDTTRERIRRLSAAARDSAAHAADDREARDAAIEQGSLDGYTVRQLAADSQLSTGRVQAIVIERTAARQARLTSTVGL